jgi:hypothetical protein
MAKEAGPFLIWSNEQRAWWSAKRAGYTTNAMDAGIYSLSDAEEICREANYRAQGPRFDFIYPPETMVPVQFLVTIGKRLKDLGSHR